MMLIEPRIAREGVAKKIKLMSKMPSVSVVYEKSVKPEPGVLRPGGVTKIEIKSRTHQTKVSMAKRTVK